MGNERHNFSKGILCIIITTIGFSTMEITGKMISNDINPLQMTFIRFLIGGLFLLPFAIWEIRKRKLQLRLNDFLFMAFTGFIGIVVSMSLFQTAIVYTKASVVAAIFSTNPIFTAPLAFFLLKEKLTKGKLIALFVSVVGIVLIFNPLKYNPDLKGILFALLAAVSFSLYIVISKKRISRYGSLVLNSFSFLFGDVILLLIMLVNHKPVLSGINTGNITQLLYLGIFVTGIGYLCYFTAMKYFSAVTASTVFFIKPALATVLSFIILKEYITNNILLGIVLIVIASILIFKQNMKAT